MRDVMEMIVLLESFGRERRRKQAPGRSCNRCPATHQTTSPSPLNTNINITTSKCVVAKICRIVACRSTTSE